MNSASVMVCNRSDATVLRSTVASLRLQTITDAEFILVDDRSEAAVWSYLESLPATDARFKVLRKPDATPKGCQTSRNMGLDACNSESLIFLDSDDLLAPSALANRMAEMESKPDADIIVGRQATFTVASEPVHWVNIPRPDVPDIDRFLCLGHPIDVPWVNGGVTFRTKALRAAGIRWRTGFHWDDVAFHFECLTSGLRARWMSSPGPPDSYYRQHDGEKYGKVLFTPDGIGSAADMLGWMYATLRDAGELSGSRSRALAFSFFQTCVLRALDMDEFKVAARVERDAAQTGLLSAKDARSLQIYRRGRQALRSSRRLTYYWNRLMRPTLLEAWYSESQSTYASVPLEPAAARAALDSLLRQIE